MKIIKTYNSGFKPSIPFLIALLVLFSNALISENLKEVMNLEGTWKFTIGDDPAWASVNYDDTDWDYVYVPRNWESNGFIDYNGYAWYRKKFEINNLEVEESLFLILGYIDDVDEVYLNGHLIGMSGTFPPLVETAYPYMRKYPLPAELLNSNGKNVIAVRVYDDYQEGGIYKGPVGIYYDSDNDLLSLNLAGYWNFETVNRVPNTSEKIYNQEDGKIYVPGYWETRGYSGYDGAGVYSNEFRLPARFNTESMMVVMGYVDDVDKVYVNDQRIGTVSELRNRENKDWPDHLILRGYEIPPGLLKAGELNSITVKVYDTEMGGGIYEGPIGLITNENFRRLKQQQVEKPYNYWDSFFKSIFE